MLRKFIEVAFRFFHAFSKILFRLYNFVYARLCDSLFGLFSVVSTCLKLFYVFQLFLVGLGWFLWFFS